MPESCCWSIHLISLYGDMEETALAFFCVIGWWHLSPYSVFILFASCLDLRMLKYQQSKDLITCLIFRDILGVVHQVSSITIHSLVNNNW